MANDNSKVAYLIFDIETVVDGDIVSKVRYPDEGLSPSAARERFAKERLETRGSDFIPHSYQIPISIVVAKVAKDFSIIDIVALDENECRPHILTKDFWHGWKAYVCPAFVTFNGRGFDLPVMEAAAYRYGVSIAKWLVPRGRLHDQPRYRYNSGGHIDLYEMLTNFGAAPFHGGLNLAASLLGKPGKMDVSGSDVQSLYDQGKTAEIVAYCRCDVLDTYFVFLRTRVLTGEIDLEREAGLVNEAKAWLQERATDVSGYQKYLDSWGDWTNPWPERE
jgi:predicted PolB exonuclease-like 3'-5' exonuclease